MPRHVRGVTLTVCRLMTMKASSEVPAPIDGRPAGKLARQERLEAGGPADRWQASIRAGSAELARRINLLTETMNP